MLVGGIEGCENDAEEVRLLLIISSKFSQAASWSDVADAVCEAASDPEAATPVPTLNAEECEHHFRKLCEVMTLDSNLSDSAKAAHIAEQLRLRRLHQIQSNIRTLDEMISVLESDEALIDNQDASLDFTVIQKHLSSAKDLFFSYPKATADQDSSQPWMPEGLTPQAFISVLPPSYADGNVESRSHPDSVLQSNGSPPRASLDFANSMGKPHSTDSSFVATNSNQISAATFTNSVIAPDAAGALDPHVMEPVAKVPDLMNFAHTFQITQNSTIAVAVESHANTTPPISQPIPSHEHLQFGSPTSVSTAAQNASLSKIDAMTMDADDMETSATARIPCDLPGSDPLSRYQFSECPSSYADKSPYYVKTKDNARSSEFTPSSSDFSVQNSELDPGAQLFRMEHSETGNPTISTLPLPGPAPAILKKTGKSRPKKKISLGTF